MVNLYIFHPPQKCHTLSKMLLKGIKRLFHHGSRPSPQISNLDESEKRRPRPNPLDLIDINLPHIPVSGLTHDDEYYKEEFDSGFCIFRVEDTLFKVDSSVFILVFVNGALSHFCHVIIGAQVLSAAGTINI